MAITVVIEKNAYRNVLNKGTKKARFTLEDSNGVPNNFWLKDRVSKRVIGTLWTSPAKAKQIVNQLNAA